MADRRPHADQASVLYGLQPKTGERPADSEKSGVAKQRSRTRTDHRRPRFSASSRRKKVVMTMIVEDMVAVGKDAVVPERRALPQKWLMCPQRQKDIKALCK